MKMLRTAAAVGSSSIRVARRPASDCPDPGETSQMEKSFRIRRISLERRSPLGVTPASCNEVNADHDEDGSTDDHEQQQ